MQLPDKPLSAVTEHEALLTLESTLVVSCLLPGESCLVHLGPRWLREIHLTGFTCLNENETKQNRDFLVSPNIATVVPASYDVVITDQTEKNFTGLEESDRKRNSKWGRTE